MKRAAPLAGLYDQFTPRERLQLVLQAHARGDETERARLVRACPRRTYVCTDRVFMAEFEAAQWVAMTAWLLWREQLTLYEAALARGERYLALMHWWLRGYVHGNNDAWKAAGQPGVRLDVEGREPTDAEIEAMALELAAENLPPELPASVDAQLALLKAVPVGLERFCARIGLAPADVLGWVAAARSLLAEAEQFNVLAVPADEEMAAEVEALFASGWPGLGTMPAAPGANG